MRKVRGRGLRLALGLAAVISAAPAPPAGRAAETLVAEVLSPRSAREQKLRVLTDQIGGRVTGSTDYERALAWGVEEFRRAGVDTVTRESFSLPAYGLWADWEDGKRGGER